MNHDGVRLDYNIVLQRKLFEEKSPYETCKFVHEVYKDIIILTGCDKKPSTKLPRAVILDCVTSSLYTATVSAHCGVDSYKTTTIIFGFSSDAISDGAYNFTVAIYGSDALVSRTFLKLSNLCYRIRNLKPTSIERPSYDYCIAESSKHGMASQKRVTEPCYSPWSIL
ncbi:similar to An12g07200 [Aspergillus luchuensis]|uniref:Similar to An12g07200 n=1 Tax=Aspergillus kawachii TaxID=1069201 RepID=A0A146FT24_ASPKA|nr:similar to An12g07200 [Aspergillus luchuensis]